MSCPTRVVVRNGGGKVVVAAGAPQRVTLSPQTVARVNAARPATRVQAKQTPVQVAEQNTVVRAGSAMGLQGPRGPAGEALGSTFTATAGQAISALRAVKVVDGVAFYADALTAADAPLLCGIAITAAGLGEEIVVRTGGEIDEPLWSWSPGPVFCGADGVLTQAPPTTGFICVVGRSHAPTKLTVEIQTPIIRG